MYSKCSGPKTLRVFFTRAPETNSSSPTRGPWRLETPFWQQQRRKQQQEWTTQPQQSQKRRNDERRGQGQRLNVGSVNSDISCLEGLNTRSAEQWSGETAEC